MDEKPVYWCGPDENEAHWALFVDPPGSLEAVWVGSFDSQSLCERVARLLNEDEREGR